METTGITGSSAPWAAPSISGVDAEITCPTCGQQLTDAVLATRWQPVERPWWPGLLAAVGLYLVVAFGQQAWNAYQFLPSPQMQLSCKLATQSGQEANSGCVLAQWNTKQFERALATVAIGVVAAVLGVGRMARPKLPGSAGSALALGVTPERRRAPGPALALALDVWTHAEALWLSCFRLLLALFGCILIVWLLGGEPPSFAVVNAAIERTLDIISSVIDVVMLPLIPS